MPQMTLAEPSVHQRQQQEEGGCINKNTNEVVTMIVVVATAHAVDDYKR